MVDLAAIPTEHGLCTYKPVVGGFDCPFERRCDSCEHFVITGADYGYWKRQEERWAAMAEGAPDEAAREYIYGSFERSSQALAGLEKALLALGLLDAGQGSRSAQPPPGLLQPHLGPGVASRRPGGDWAGGAKAAVARTGRRRRRPDGPRREHRRRQARPALGRGPSGPSTPAGERRRPRSPPWTRPSRCSVAPARRSPERPSLSSPGYPGRSPTRTTRPGRSSPPRRPGPGPGRGPGRDADGRNRRPPGANEPSTPRTRCASSARRSRPNAASSATSWAS